MQKARRHGVFVCVHQTNATVHSFAFQTGSYEDPQHARGFESASGASKSRARKGLITRNDGNPLGWLARRRIAGGHGLERSVGVHFGWKKSTATQQSRWFY